MAVSAREVIMIFRGQNYLSSAVRRVSADVAGLSRLQQVQIRAAQAQGMANRLQLQKRSIAAELAAVSAGGSRRLALENSISSNLTAMQRTRNRITAASPGIIKQANSMRNLGFEYKAAAYQLANYETISNRTLEKINREGMPKNMPLAAIPLQKDLEARVSAYRDQIKGAANDAVALANAQKVSTMQYRDQLSKSSQLKARTSEMNTLEKYKADLLAQQNLEIATQNIQLNQAMAAVKAAPIASWQGFFRTVEHGARVINMVALIMGATMGFMAKSYADFQTQATVAATQSTVAGQNTVRQVQINASAIERAVRQMMAAGRTIAKPEELTGAAYEIYSGVSFTGNQQEQLQKGITLMKEFNKVVTANAGLVTMNEVTAAGITIMNDFKVAVKDMPDALNYMQAAVRFGRLTMSQFISTLNQAAPAAMSVGYSFDQMANAMSFLSRFFPSIRYASTGYSRLIEIISRSREKLKAHGVTVTDSSGHLLKMDQIIANLTKKFPGLITGTTTFQRVLKQTTGLTGTQQAARVGTVWAQHQQLYHTMAGQISNDNNELVKSLEAVQKSTGVTWAEFVNQMRAVVLQLGHDAIPAFAYFGHYVQQLLNWFDKLSPHTKRLVALIVTFGSLGALLGSTVAMIVGGIGALVTGAMIWRTMSVGVKGAVESLNLLAGSLGASQQGLARTATATAAAGNGFARVGFLLRTTMYASLLVLIPLMIIYHRQILGWLSDHQHLRQAIALASLGLMVVQVGALTKAFLALRLATRLVAVGGLVTLLVLIDKFSLSADALRSGLDALFNSWVGYVGTITLMTVAVVKLKTALIELGLVSAGTSFISMIGAAGPALIGRINAARTAATAAQTAALTTEAGVVGTGVLTTAAGTKMIRGYGGQIIGKAAIQDTAVATSGLAASMGSFLPMLAAGGLLATGLWMWKRHLDAVHDAQVRVAREQDRLNKAISRTDLTKLTGAAGARLESYQREQIAYNRARKALLNMAGVGNVQDAIDKAHLPGASDDLREAALNFSDASHALYVAGVQWRNSITAFTKFATRDTQLSRMQDQYKQVYAMVANFKKVMPYEAMPGQFLKTLTPEQRDLAKKLGIDSLKDALTKLSDLRKEYPGAVKALNQANALVDKQLRGFLDKLSNLGEIPTIRGSVMNDVINWMKQLQKLGVTPAISQIQMYVKVATKLDVSEWDKLPDKIKQMLKMLRSGKIKELTNPQLDTLVKMVFKIDPNSTSGKMLEAMIKAYIAAVMPNLSQVWDYFAQAAGLEKAQVPSSIGAWVTQGGGVYGPPNPNQVTKPGGSGIGSSGGGAKPPPIPRSVTDAKELARIAKQTTELAGMYARATKEQNAGQLGAAAKDWLAYYRLLGTYEGQHKANMKKVFDDELQYRQDALTKSANNEKTITTQTFADILQGIRGMYNNFLQEEQGRFGQLFSGPWLTSPTVQYFKQWGFLPDAKDLQKDINQQISQYTKFNNQIAVLQKKKAPKMLITQLMSMSPQDALQYTQMINSMSAGQRKTYFAAIDRAEKLINDQTMNRLKAQVKIYRTFGQDVAKAIIAGITDENQALTTALTKFIKQIFPGLPVGKTGAGGKDTHTKPNTKAATGIVVPGVGNRDTVPAMLTPGEIVFNKRQQRNLGKAIGKPGAGPHELFKVINKPQFFANGGVAESLSHAISRMRHEGYSNTQIAGQIHRWHPDWSTHKIGEQFLHTSSGGWLGQKLTRGAHDITGMPKATAKIVEVTSRDWGSRFGYQMGLVSKHRRDADIKTAQIMGRSLLKGTADLLRHPLRDPVGTALLVAPFARGVKGKVGTLSNQGIKVDHASVLTKMNEDLKGLGLTEKETTDSIAFMQEVYKKNYIPRANELALTLKKSGVKHANIKPWLSGRNTIDEFGNPLDNPNPLPSFTVDFLRKRKSSLESPGFTAFARKAGKWDIDDVIDFMDTDFFRLNDPLQKRYFSTIDALRGVKTDQAIRLYRAMTLDELDAWRMGKTIPSGKFFAKNSQQASGMDIQGVFPSVFSFKVDPNAVVQTSEGIYQLSKNAKLDKNTNRIRRSSGVQDWFNVPERRHFLRGMGQTYQGMWQEAFLPAFKQIGQKLSNDRRIRQLSDGRRLANNPFVYKRQATVRPDIKRIWADNVERLARAGNIELQYYQYDPRMWYNERFMRTHPITNRANYITGLHELSHFEWYDKLFSGKQEGTYAYVRKQGVIQNNPRFKNIFGATSLQDANLTLEKEAAAWKMALDKARDHSDSAKNFARLYLTSYFDMYQEEGVGAGLYRALDFHGPMGKYFFPHGRRDFKGRLPNEADRIAKGRHPLASGGVVDKIPAMLSAGEIVFNKRQQMNLAKMLGLYSTSTRNLFDIINRPQKFENGGIAGRPILNNSITVPTSTSTSDKAGDTHYHNYNINLNGTSDSANTETKIRHAIFAATQHYRGRH